MVCALTVTGVSRPWQLLCDCDAGVGAARQRLEWVMAIGLAAEARRAALVAVVAGNDAGLGRVHTARAAEFARLAGSLVFWIGEGAV